MKKTVWKHKRRREFFATQKNMYVMDIPNVHDESTLVTWKAEVKKLAAKIEEEWRDY